MNEIYLKASNVSHSYDTLLFLDVELSLQAKQKISIIGESGCGKSTLLHILSTFLKPTVGNIEIFNQDIYKLNKKKINKIRRHSISLIFQQHYLFRGFSAWENLVVSSKISNIEIDENMISLFNLKHCIHKQTGDLSGGEQQRLSILRSLIKKPKIIFADEPTGNLDVKTRDVISSILDDFINEYNSSMIMVTHDRELAKRNDIIFELEDNKLIQRN